MILVKRVTEREVKEPQMLVICECEFQNLNALKQDMKANPADYEVNTEYMLIRMSKTLTLSKETAYKIREL